MLNKDELTEIVDRGWELSEQSTCNKLKAASVLILKDGTQYEGISGGKVSACTDNESDYCLRHSGDNGNPLSEYELCKSPCSEGDAILQALQDRKSVEDGILVSTHSPCDRCSLVIADQGIHEVHFAQFKNGAPRDKDNANLAALMLNGIDVYHAYKPDGPSSPLEVQKMQLTPQAALLGQALLGRPENPAIMQTFYGIR